MVFLLQELMDCLLAYENLNRVMFYHGIGGDWWDIYCQVTIEGERPLFVLDTADHTVALVYDSNGVEVLVLHDRITLLQEAENMTLKKWDYQHN